MTELEENTLRSLLSRLREEKPDEFIAIVFQTLTFPYSDNAIVCFQQSNDRGIPDAAVIVFKGPIPTKWAVGSMSDLEKKLKEIDDD